MHNTSLFNNTINQQAKSLTATLLQEQHSKHRSHSQKEHRQFDQVLVPDPVPQQVTPNISPHIDEVASHEGHYVVLGPTANPAQRQSRKQPCQRHEVHQSVAHHCLEACKSAFHQNAHISHLAWDFVGNDGDHDGYVDVRVLRGKAHANREPIEEVVDERRQKVQVPCRFFALEAFKTDLFHLIMAVVVDLPQLLLLPLYSGWAICALVFMFVPVIVFMAMVMLALPPVMMHDPQRFKEAFDDKKKENCADEDQRYDLAICFFIFIGVRQYVYYRISDDGPAPERVKQINEVEEGVRTDHAFDADQKQSCTETKQ